VLFAHGHNGDPAGIVLDHGSYRHPILRDHFRTQFAVPAGLIAHETARH
jgi:hypothetical protein